MHIRNKDLNLMNRNHVGFIIDEIEEQQNIQRKRIAWEAYQVRSGNQKDFVKEKLQTIYPETHEKFRIGDIGICKKVIDKRAKAYKTPPVRTLDTDTETESLQDIYKIGMFSRVFKEFDDIFNLHKYAFLWTTFINPKDGGGEKGKYIGQALRPFQYDLIRDERTGEVLIFILNLPDSEITGLREGQINDSREQAISEAQADTSAETRIYAMWSGELNGSNHIVVKVTEKLQAQPVQGRVGQTEEVRTKEIVMLPIPDNAANENPFKRIPGAYLQADTSVDYPTRNNLADQSIEWNVGWSDLKTAGATQGHGQLVIKHPEGQNMKKKHLGQHVALSLPQKVKSGKVPVPTEASYINASPDLAGQLNISKTETVLILDEHGVKSSGRIDGGVEAFASGFDRLLSEADTQDVIEENQMLYGPIVEQQTYLSIKAGEETLNRNTFRSDSIAVKYSKPKVLVTDKETREVIQLDLDMGLIEEHEKFMRLDPNLTEEEAREKLEKIDAEREERMKPIEVEVNEPDIVEEVDDEEITE